MTLDNADTPELAADRSLYLSRDGSLYLSGNYAPVLDEVTAYDLPVTGQIPAELSGRLIRVGPNPIAPVDDPVNHNWLLGTGMVHGVRLRVGKAEWYCNRFVRGTRPGPISAGRWARRSPRTRALIP